LNVVALMAKGTGVVEWAVALSPRVGETSSGDQYGVWPYLNGMLIAAADGLGHGADAAEAARRAMTILGQHEGRSLAVLAQRCHQGLQRTRGVVLSMAAFDPTKDTMTWLGVGNVVGVFRRAAGGTGKSTELLLARGGVVGAEFPQLRTATITVTPGDLLVLATDGIRRDFVEHFDPAPPPDRIVDEILARYRASSDDALVLAARYLGGRTRGP